MWLVQAQPDIYYLNLSKSFLDTKKKKKSQEYLNIAVMLLVATEWIKNSVCVFLCINIFIIWSIKSLI